MTTIDTTSSAYATSDASSTVSSSSGSSFDGTSFLNLLVAQLKYQSPDDSTSSSELMQQTATLAQVESLNTISDQNSQLLTLQKSLSAGALVGRTVSYTDSDGGTVSGVVTSVKIGSGDTTESQAVVGGKSVSLSSLSSVSE